MSLLRLNGPVLSVCAGRGDARAEAATAASASAGFEACAATRTVAFRASSAAFSFSSAWIRASSIEEAGGVEAAATGTLGTCFFADET